MTMMMIIMLIVRIVMMVVINNKDDNNCNSDFNYQITNSLIILHIYMDGF